MNRLFTIFRKVLNDVHSCLKAFLVVDRRPVRGWDRHGSDTVSERQVEQKETIIIIIHILTKT